MPTTAERSAPEPLLLLPGMLCDERLWAAPADVLARSHDVACLPLRGQSVEAAVAAVLRAADEAGTDRFAVAGLSLGGIVAMHVAVAAPERVSRLAVLSTNPRQPTPEQHRSWTTMQQRAEAGDLLGVARDLVPVLFGADSRTEPALVRLVEDMADRIGVDDFLDQLALQHSRTDLRPRLHAVGGPTLVVAAADDALCSIEMHEEIASAVPGSRLATVARCGHLSTLERPEAVTALLSDWLAEPPVERPLSPLGART